MTPLTPKELKVLNFIRLYSEKHQCPPTYSEIQAKFDYKSASSVQQFIGQLVEKGYLEAPLGQSKKRALRLIEPSASDVVQLPLEGVVAAGYLTEAVQNRESVTIPRSFLKSGGEYFALKVKGDSMIGDCIMDGDIVIAKRQSTAHNGQTVIAMVDTEATLKRFYQKKTHIELHPANSQFEIIKVSKNSDFKILGILTCVIRQL